MTRPKRKCTRLSPSTWAEIDALWSIGDVTLPELAERYSVHTRTLQAHFAKRKILKGAKAAEMAAAVMKEVFEGELGDQDTITRRAKETREATYTNATVVEGLIMAQLRLAQKDPTQAFKALTALKMLSLAAAGLERVQAAKWRALGLDKENALPGTLPVLTFRDLTPGELEDLREPDEEYEIGDPITPVIGEDKDVVGAEEDESTEIVEEGEEVELVERPKLEDKTVLRDAAGCRFVRGAEPDLRAK